jgi:hypothetical protein
VNTPEVKDRTGPSPGVFMGNVKALEEYSLSNTLFKRIKRWKNFFILRPDKPVWVSFEARARPGNIRLAQQDNEYSWTRHAAQVNAALENHADSFSVVKQGIKAVRTSGVDLM